MPNSMVLFFFHVLGWEYHFWENLVQKIKIVSLSWNLVLTLIWIWRIHWWCSFFLFWLEVSFLGKFVCKNRSCLLNLKLERRLIWICKIRWWISFFPFVDQKSIFPKKSQPDWNFENWDSLEYLTYCWAFYWINCRKRTFCT